MRNFLKIMILPPVALLSLATSCDRVILLDKINEANLPQTFELQKVNSLWENESTKPIDLNQDGTDEILVMSNQRAHGDPAFVIVNSFKGDDNWFHNNYRGLITLPENVLNVDTTRNGILYISEMINDTSYFHLIDATGKTVASELAAVNPHTSDRPWWCNNSVVGTIDINRDGHSDIIGQIHTDYAYQPRGIFAYDVHNHTFLWRYPTGFVPYFLHLIDIDDDGYREIVLGSSAPANGVGKFVNGTDDATSYITILDSLGQLKFSHRFSEGFNQVRLFPHTFHPDSIPAVFYIATSNRFHSHQRDELGILKPGAYKPHVLAEFDKPLAPDLCFIQTNSHHKADLLLYRSDGYFEIRDQQMQILHSLSAPDFFPSSVESIDIDEDGSPEILVTGLHKNHNYLCLFNTRLNLRALLRLEYSRNIGSPYLLHRGKTEKPLIFLQHGTNNYTLRLRRQLAAFLPLPMNWLIVITLTGLVLMIVLVLRRSHVISRTAGLQALQTVFNNLRESIIVLDQNGRIVQYNREIINLGLIGSESTIGLPYRQFFSSAEFEKVGDLIESSYQKREALLSTEMNLRVGEKPVTLLIYVAFFPLGGIPSLGRIVLLRPITEVVEHERALAWAGMAQRLAHELKSPLSTVRLSAQQIQADLAQKPGGPGKSEKYLQHILQQVDRLGKTTEHFLKFASLSKTDLQAVDIHALLNKCIFELSIKLIPNVKVATHFAPCELTIMADHELIMVALNNLFDNSLNAMTEGGNLIVTTRTLRVPTAEGEGYYAEIRIADSGRGISKQNISQLFRPYFSRSPGGTGLGLVISQKIIQDHNGHIAIDSMEGKGTLVTIRLPLLRDGGERVEER